MRPRGENIEYDKLAARCDARGEQIEIHKARIRELESQDEIHWKTRRTLLAREKALEAALGAIIEACDSRQSSFILSRIKALAIVHLPKEPPIAQSKSQQKRFEGVVPFAEETKVMHDKCEHGKGLGDHCEPCGDDDDTQTV